MLSHVKGFRMQESLKKHVQSVDIFRRKHASTRHQCRAACAGRPKALVDLLVQVGSVCVEPMNQRVRAPSICLKPGNQSVWVVSVCVKPVDRLVRAGSVYSTLPKVFVTSRKTRRVRNYLYSST